MKMQFQEENIVRSIELLVESHAWNHAVPDRRDQGMITVQDMEEEDDASTLVVHTELYHHLTTVKDMVGEDDAMSLVVHTELYHHLNTV